LAAPPTTAAAHAHATQAHVYEAEGNDAQTYLLLYRHADLVLQNLQTHPDRNQPHNRKALNAATAAVYSDLKKLERIAPRIKQRHDEHQDRRRRQQDALKALEGRGLRSVPREPEGVSVQERASKRTWYDAARPALDAQENQSLATRLAQREVKRRDTARRSVRQHGVSEEEEHVRRTGGSWDTWQDDLAQGAGHDDLSSQLEEVRRLQQNGHGMSQSTVSAPRHLLVHFAHTRSARHSTPTPTTTP